MKSVWLALAAVAVLVCRGDDDVTAERFPDADTVIVNEIEKVEYHPDGTYETTDESWTKILTEKGRRDESTTTLDYSRRYGEGAIVYVGAIGTNGEEREIDVSKTTKESTDNASMSSNIYDPLDRKIVCRIPGLAVGETVHVKTRRKMTRARTERKWADLSVMEWTCPIVRATYEVKAPAELPIRKKAIRNPLGNIVASERKLDDGSVLHTFVVTNSAQAFPEPDMPPMYTQVQNVRLSTAADWPEISKWYWELCAAHLAKTNAAMVAKVRELTKDLRRETKDAVIRRIFKFVSQEVRYMGLTMEDTSPGYSPHDVDITFDNRYGVCRDKAALLVTMLRLAGFKAFPVLINVGAKLDPEVPQPFFNHAIAAVEAGWGKYILMDPTNENAKDLFPAYLGNSSYLVARPEGETLLTSPVESPERNSLDVATEATLSKDGSLFVESDIRFGGINDIAYRHALVRRKPEDRVKLFERLVKGIAPGAELVRCEIEPKDMRDTEKPVRVRLASRLPEMTLRGETRDELNVPFLSKGLGVVNFILEGNTSLEKRKYALALDSTARVRETVKVDLAGSLGAALELPKDERNEEGGFRYDRRFSLTNGTLSAERTLSIAAVEFSPDGYQALREEIKRVEAAERKRPVFAADGLAEAHVRILLDSSEATVLSDREWIVTNTVVKEVLSYDGKKKSAELKFNYNPTWKNVELVSAVVSNRDGRTYAVSAKEMNVMDCAWAAAAPRYPAGKLLVVNLPSVEIGSVISYASVITVTNAPAPFYAVYNFDAPEPVDRRVARVNDWKRDVRNLKRLPNEPGQPYASLWRDQEIVSFCRFREIDLQVGEVDPETVGVLTGDTRRETCATVKAIRDWMAKNVKVVGPALYDLPLDRQLTPPETVVAERYATRLDYVRTMCALLRGAGCDADVVLGTINEDDPEIIRNRDKYGKPDVREFASALCRVRVTEGGFLGFFGETKTYFIGTENEYTPLGATVYVGSDFFDPESAEFGVVTVPDEALKPFDGASTDITVRENGAVDMVVEATKRGPGVGSFRKKYAEMLPEDRSRHHQELLGGIAQAASATGELETDVEGYPARRAFACYVPDYATVGKDAITIQVPALDCPVPNYTGTVRRSPFAVEAEENESQVVTVRFPEGYTEIEHLPESFTFADPSDPSRPWLEATVTSEVKDGVLTVKIGRRTCKRHYTWHAASLFGLVRDWRRIGTSRSNRTISVRKPTIRKESK